MSALGGAYRCRNHLDRDGVGVCVPCRRVVCAECSTRLDGINHCRECLERKLGRARRAPGAVRRGFERIAAAAAVALAYAALLGIFYASGAVASGVAWFGAGSRLAETGRRMRTVERALRDFRSDCGRFPTQRESFAALEDDEPDPASGPIAGWRGPYLHAESDEDPLADGFGSKLRYVSGPARPRPAILSLGPDRTLDTDLEALRHGDPGGGDDIVVWTRFP